MTRALAAALALAWLAAAGSARAADDLAEAKARFRRAVELYKEKRWQEAMAEFEAAYRAKPHGAIHFNVAQCRERLDDWPGAIRSYHDYLREVPEAPDRDAIRAEVRRLEERLARSGVQVLLLDSSPPGARVVVEGIERGRTPLHVVLRPGTYAVSLSLPGHEDWRRTVEVGAAASTALQASLAALAAAPPAAIPLPPPPDLSARPAAAAPGRAPLPAPPPPGRTGRPLPAWIAGGTAVAAAVAGAWFGASARADARAIDALPAPDGATASRKADSAQSKARTANVLFGVAGGAAALGVSLYLLDVRF